MQLMEANLISCITISQMILWTSEKFTSPTTAKTTDLYFLREWRFQKFHKYFNQGKQIKNSLTGLSTILSQDSLYTLFHENYKYLELMHSLSNTCCKTLERDSHLEPMKSHEHLKQLESLFLHITALAMKLTLSAMFTDLSQRNQKEISSSMLIMTEKS